VSEIKPTGDHILVELDDAPAQSATAGGIIIPDNAKVARSRLMRRGKVVAVGPKVDGRVRPGEQVCFLQQDGYRVPSWPGWEHREEQLRMLRERELMGVCE
jgi:co-chaperonin GroES (HSP10)